MRVLVTGATGFVGSRLVPALVARNHDVRALVRSSRPSFNDAVEVVRGDVLDAGSLTDAFEGIEVAYYLVHSMSAEKAFEELDRRAAENFAQAARTAGVKRIIYLGGLSDPGEALSSHLASRAEVGDVLASTGIPVTTFRAAMVLGPGGSSYEMLRRLVERLPVMIAPRWVETRSQPIAVGDVITYLVECLERPETTGRVLDIGGPDVMTYRQMMTRFAAVEGKRRWIIGVPVLTPRLSSYWVNIVTPIPASVARPLIDGLRNEMVVRDPAVRTLIPFEPKSFEDAVMSSLAEGLRESLAIGKVMGVVPEVANAAFSLGYEPRQPGTIFESRVLAVDASCAYSWEQIRSIGGSEGWYYMDWGWTLRGLVDAIIGGVGNVRQRPTNLAIGEHLDTWVVEKYREERDLTLRSRMRLPKLARLGLHVRPHNDKSVVIQWVQFQPNLLTWMYWWAAYPAHRLVFRGMLRAIARRAMVKQGRMARVHA